MSCDIGEGTYIGLIHEEFSPIIKVGKYTSIATDCFFYGASEHPSVINRNVVSNYPFFEKCQLNYVHCGGNPNINIGNDVWIGQYVTVLGGVTIGDGAIIGCNSVVAKDVPPYAVVVGNPGIVVKYRFESDIIKKLLLIKWWDWGGDLISKRIGYFSDINKFVEAFYDHRSE